MERDRKGLTLRELARRLEVSPSLISQIETGKIRPSVRTLYAMLQEYDVSVEQLFADAGMPRGDSLTSLAPSPIRSPPRCAPGSGSAHRTVSSAPTTAA